MMKIGSVYIKLQFLASRSLIYLGSEPFVTQSQLVGVGIVAALGLTALLARRDGVSLAASWGVMGALAASALLGGWFVPLIFGGDGFSSVGALAGAAMVALVLRTGIVGRDAALLDVVAPGGLFALALARLGCLFEGCDFGSVTAGPLAVAYEAPHPVWFLHVARGLVDAGAMASSPVHPFPLYIAVPTMLVAVASTRVRGGRGRRALIVVLGYAISRSFAEWTRDALTSHTVAGMPGGFIAAVVVGLGAMLWWIDSERRGRGDRNRVQTPATNRG